MLTQLEATKSAALLLVFSYWCLSSPSGHDPPNQVSPSESCWMLVGDVFGSVQWAVSAFALTNTMQMGIEYTGRLSFCRQQDEAELTEAILLDLGQWPKIMLHQQTREWKSMQIWCQAMRSCSLCPRLGHDSGHCVAWRGPKLPPLGSTRDLKLGGLFRAAFSCFMSQK